GRRGGGDKDVARLDPVDRILWFEGDDRSTPRDGGADAHRRAAVHRAHVREQRGDDAAERPRDLERGRGTTAFTEHGWGSDRGGCFVERGALPREGVGG